MNKQRRNLIQNNVSVLTNIKDNIESILDDEQFTYDNIPENLQYSERGITSEESIDSMENALGYIQEAINNLEDAINSLEEI